MEIQVAYGDGLLPIRLPAGIRADVVDVEEPDPLPSAASAVREALRNPIASLPLRRLAEGKRSVILLVPDGTRPIPLPTLLPPILEELDGVVPPEGVTVLFATGMHRPVTEAEGNRLLGDALSRSVRWASHDCERTKTIGRTARGTPIAVSEAFLDAELRVAIGLVEPHLLAGFSGGRKLVAPGVIGIEAMPILHGPGIIGHRKARVGILDGNPFHEEALAIARAAGLHFAVNVTIGKRREISGVYAGDFDASHRAACAELERSARAVTRGERDLVVTCGGGAPLDSTFYQSVKGICGAESLVRRGGAILLCASCIEGWGSEPFASLLAEVPDLESFLVWAKKPEAFRKDQWMVQHLREAMEGLEVHLFSENIDPDRARFFGLHPVRTPEEAIASCINGMRDASVAVIPRGPYTWAVPSQVS